MNRTRLWSVAAVAALGAGVLVTAPAQAGSTWGSPQEVSSKFGKRLAVSDGGRVAVWLRTNKTSTSASGPIRASWFKNAKKGWWPSSPIPGASGSTDVQLSSNGNQALIETPGLGYQMAVRDSKAAWLTATIVASGTNLGEGVMSGDAKTVVYVDWGPETYPQPPGKLYYVTQNADGTWPAPTQLGTVDPDGRYYYNDVAFSKDGSTLAWVTDTFALMGATRNADGSWTAPTMIRQFASSPSLEQLQLSADGSRIMWVPSGGDGILTSTRSGTVWAPASTVTVDETNSTAMSPNGLSMAWGNSDGQMVASRWNGAKWLKPQVLGSVGTPDIALTDKTLAWTSNYYKGSSLRSMIWKGGKWQKLVKHSSTGFSPEVSYDGMTLVWSSTGNKRIYSVKR